MSTLTCGFIGLGLIGGSIAKALRANIPSIHMIAYDVNPEALSMAKEEGVIDEILNTIDTHFTGCDYIFLCAPVAHNDTNLLEVKKYLGPDTILTDVGSVKTDIHTHIAEAGLNKCFIGGHPMAGSERFGYRNSKAGLLENAYYILTPTDEVPAEKVTAFQMLIKNIGAIPLILTCAQHDYVTGAISHLPHVISAALVNLVKDSDSKEGIMKLIAAGGFKDITRISSSSPTMWQQICLTNTENILTLLDKYIAALGEIRNTISTKEPEQLYDFFDSAREYRESFTNASSGPIKVQYAFTIDIGDKPGAIAAIASLLAMHDVSIKNIGINHNREFAEGALRIEFDKEEALTNAADILTKHGYTVYQKNK